jgi:D-lyxose ketol-isomerase
MEEFEMKELDRALSIALKGKEAAQALGRFHRQMKAWGVALPAVAPLVLDFGLGDFGKIGLIEYWIANEMKAGYCGKYLFVFDGQTCPMHRHRKKHETFFIVKGRVAMTYNGKRRQMGEGEVLPVERWKFHSFTGIGPALLLEVSTPCEVDDNYFEDPRIPIGGNYRGGKVRET